MTQNDTTATRSAQVITVTRPQLAAAFELWCREQQADPENFSNDHEYGIETPEEYGRGAAGDLIALLERLESA